MPVAGIATGIAQSIAREVKKMAIIERIKTKSPIKIGDWLTIGKDCYIKPIKDSSEFRGYVFGKALESTPENMQEGDLAEIKVQTDEALALGDRRDSGKPKVIMGNKIFTDDETDDQPLPLSSTFVGGTAGLSFSGKDFGGSITGVLSIKSDGAFSFGTVPVRYDPNELLQTANRTKPKLIEETPAKKKETPEEAIKKMRNMKRSLIF